MSNQFSDVVGSTVHPQRYATSLVLSNNRIIEIHISDFPAIETFPEDSLQEWNLHCSALPKQQNPRTQKPPQSFCRLRQASAYVLVFDSSRPAPTFQYIRQIRDQILRNGGKDVYKKPMVVAANKQDLIHMGRGPPSVAGGTTTKTGMSSWSNRGPLMGKGRRRGNKYIHHQHHPSSGTNGSHNANGLNSGGNGGKNGHNGTTGTSSEWSCIVRKQWRCLYVECSAKFNWQVCQRFLFRSKLAPINKLLIDPIKSSFSFSIRLIYWRTRQGCAFYLVGNLWINWWETLRCSPTPVV